MTYYKKVRKMKDGSLKPLFINKTKPFILNEWQKSEYHPTKGFAPRSIHGNIETGEGCDGGFHLVPYPDASWIADELATGEKRVWITCEVRGAVKEYQRPQGLWYLAEEIMPLKELTPKEVKEILNRR